jgi:hypothetical protein
MFAHVPMQQQQLLRQPHPQQQQQQQQLQQEQQRQQQEQQQQHGHQEQQEQQEQQQQPLSQPTTISVFEGPQADLLKFLDSNNNNPNFGMALEEAVDEHLITEAEARQILQSSAGTLRWSSMLTDANRNKRLQVFIKGNRWMRRQGFKDFEEIEELEQEERMRVLEQEQNASQKEVLFSVFHTSRLV